MPVFARTKLQIWDDCLFPGVPFMNFRYTGPNPQNLYKKIKDLLIVVWKVDLSEVQEKEFGWDRESATEKFNVKLEVTKDLDSFSYEWIEVELNGTARHSRQFGKEGEATIRITGALRTEYPQETLFQRSLFYEMFRTFYHKVIYEDTRKKYLQGCRDHLNTFQEEIKSFLNLLQKSS